MFPFFLQTAIYPRRGSFNHPRKVKFSATARNKTNFSQMTEPNQAYSSTWIRAKRSTHASDSLLRPHRADCSFDSSKVIPSTTRSMFTAHSEEMFTTLPNIVPLALWVWPCHWIVSLTQSITHKRYVVHSALLKSSQIRSNATASDYHCCWETWLFFYLDNRISVLLQVFTNFSYLVAIYEMFWKVCYCKLLLTNS